MIVQLSMLDKSFASSHAERVWRCIRDGTPPKVPMPIRAVVAAKTDRKGITAATVELFDGTLAEVEVSTWGAWKAWRIRWTRLDQDFYWDRKQWVRCPSLDAESEAA